MKTYITKNNSNLKKLKEILSYAKFQLACVAFSLSAIFLFFSNDSFAKNNLSEENAWQKYSEEITQIESYLNNIHNLSSKFIQESADGKITQGKLFLSRPGKMRLEYDGPPKILIIVNGSVLAYKDIELDETSYLSTNTTPASFLTRANISFMAKDVEITDIKKSDNQIKISVMKKNRKEAGEFSVIFSTNPLKFIKMEVKNDLEQITVVTLENPDFSTSLNSNLFVIKNNNLPN
ncbi:MAG: outer membrane lipoprotein carrier protein LolA [Rickettsiales bacterium]|nr:outer membrane lipoprotein carrier protein LolA [Rickettsiales bacterium]